MQFDPASPMGRLSASGNMKLQERVHRRWYAKNKELLDRILKECEEYRVGTRGPDHDQIQVSHPVR